MSRNSSGTYTLPSGNPVVSGTLIEATWANSTLSDIATALTGSLSRSAEGGMLASLRLFDGTSSVPGLAWGSETTTGFYRAGAGDTRLVVTGSQVMQFLSTGVSVTGTLSATGNFAINTDKFTVAASSGNTVVAGTLGVTGAATLSSTLAVTGATTLSSTLAVNGATVTVSNSTAFFPQIINRNTTSDANASYLVLDKVRGSSVVQNGDVLGNLVFRGFDGTQYLQGAYINAIVSAAPGTNDMPADLVFGTTADGGAGPSERMRLNNAGNLGLGVTPPSGSSTPGIFVSGITNIYGSTTNGVTYAANTYRDSGVFKYVSSSTATRYSQEAGTHAWYTAPSGTAGNAISFTQAMTLDASGNLGVGTTSPSAKLHAVAGDNLETTAIGLFVANNGSQSVRIGYNGIYQTAAQALLLGTNNTERARIDSSGNLLVGTTSHTDGSMFQTISSSTAVNGYRTTTNPAAGIIGAYSDIGGTKTVRAFFRADGGLANFSANNVNLSDERLKKDIAPAGDYLAKICAIPVKTFRYKDQSETEDLTLGVIAQDVQQIAPELVSDDGFGLSEKDKQDYLSIYQTDLQYALMKCIQEQQAIIEQLKADVAALKAPTA